MLTVILGIVAIIILILLLRFIWKAILVVLGLPIVALYGVALLLYNFFAPIRKHFYLILILGAGFYGLSQQNILIAGISIFTYIILALLLSTRDSKKEYIKKIQKELSEKGILDLKQLKILNLNNKKQKSDKSFSFSFFIILHDFYARKNVSHGISYLNKLTEKKEIAKQTIDNRDFYITLEKNKELNERLIPTAQNNLKDKLEKYLSQHGAVLEYKLSSLLLELSDTDSNNSEDLITYHFAYQASREWIDKNIQSGNIVKEEIITKEQVATYTGWQIKEQIRTCYFYKSALQTICQNYLKQDFILPSDLSSQLKFKIEETEFPQVIKILAKIYPTFSFLVIKNEKSENPIFAINNSKKAKYTCEQCNEIFTNLQTYGSHHYCKDCLEEIKLAEKEGRRIKRKINKENLPPALRKKMADFEKQKNISPIKHTESTDQKSENVNLQPIELTNVQNIDNHTKQNVEQDYEDAVTYWIRNSEQDEATPMSNVGINNQNVQDVEQIYEKKLERYRRAAEQGDANAQYNLGLCYYDGQDVEQDYEKAVAWWRRAAEQGDTDAQYNLGACYYDGQGVQQDYEEAVAWWRRAAEQGFTNAQFNLGVCYEHGQGVQQDYEEAVAWWRRAAEQGNAGAQNNLGASYAHGQGVQQDCEEAVAWYRRAAEQGFANAQFNLGVCYEHGQGVQQDYEEAVAWYRRAAEQGFANAQFNLGVCYEHGQGVQQDYKEAVAWYRRAAEQGDTDAQRILDIYHKK